MTNRPMKKVRVGHSTSCRAVSVEMRVMAISSPAPSRATTEGA